MIEIGNKSTRNLCASFVSICIVYYNPTKENALCCTFLDYVDLLALGVVDAQAEVVTLPTVEFASPIDYPKKDERWEGCFCIVATDD